MSAIKTQAFILKTQVYRDTSLLGDFYTRDHGRIKGVIKGIRDTRARFGSTLEPFSLNEILFYKKKRSDLHLVTQVDLLNLYSDVREDLERLAYASYMSELVAELVQGEEPGHEIFDLLQDGLQFLSSGASVKRCARIFELKLMDALGFAPQTKGCTLCGAEASEAYFFNAAIGGVHCKDCSSKSKSLLKDTSLPISKGTINFMEHARRAAFKELYSIKVAQEVGGELERILRRFTDYHLSHKLKSLIFMEKMGY